MSNRVAIPRLLNTDFRHKPGRTGRACDECRARKAKCDGVRPTCSFCDKQQMKCYYSEPKRKREQTELELARNRADGFEKVLREILNEVTAPVSKKIKGVLKPLPLSQETLKSASFSSAPSSPSSGGSLDAAHALDEDLNRGQDSRAIGYLGESSEVSWMRRLEMKTASGGSSNNGQNPENSHSSPLPRTTSTASMSYHVEPADYPAEEVDNIYALPERSSAERLLVIYMDSVQPSLPVIRSDLFRDQFESFISGNSGHPGRKWLALLNLVFAISTKLCEYSGQDTQNTGHQFFSRAQILNISESIVEDHEDLQQVQIETLAAFYLMISSHINRAWKMIGIATRSSISLGLHLRATHRVLDAQALEARHRLFWSIFSLENLLSDITGRASGLSSIYCSAPPPLASRNMCPFTNGIPKGRVESASENPPMNWTIDQEYKHLTPQRELTREMEATRELYFFSLVDITSISHAASASVYNREALKIGWSEIQSRIDYYNEIMLDWNSGLPDSLKFDELNVNPVLSPRQSYGVSLALHFHSARIILNRPCVTRQKGGMSSKGHLSRARKDIEMTCLQSALAILSIFPEEPSTSWFRCVTWWNILHFLVQSTTIFLINISYLESTKSQASSPTSDTRTNQFPTSPPTAFNPDTILAAIRKALRWLSYLGKTDASARRAFNLCNNCIHRMDISHTDLASPFRANYPSDSPNLAVPTDQSHQQYRSKHNVPHSQFVGSRSFGFDGKMDMSSSPVKLEVKEESRFVQPLLGTLAVDVDMSDYIPDPEIATLDDVLACLAG